MAFPPGRLVSEKSFVVVVDVVLSKCIYFYIHDTCKHCKRFPFARLLSQNVSMKCLYTSQMDNLLLCHSSGFLDGFLACWVLMSWYIGIHSNSKFKGQELMAFKSFVSKLWCHSRMFCDQEKAMSTSSNTSSLATDQIIVNKQAQVLNGQCTSLSRLRLFGYVLAHWEML